MLAQVADPITGQIVVALIGAAPHLWTAIRHLAAAWRARRRKARWVRTAALRRPPLVTSRLRRARAA